MKEVEKLRAEQKSTIPSTRAAELKANPFLLAKNVDEFANVRKMKDTFSFLSPYYRLDSFF